MQWFLVFGGKTRMLKQFRSFSKNNFFISASILYVIGTILLQGISFLTTPIFTRIMEPDDFGITAVFFTWVAFFSIFIGFQVSGSVATARIHMEEFQFANYLRNITLLTITVSIVVISILMIFRTYLANILSIEERLVPHLLIQSLGTSLSALYGMYLVQTKQPKTKIIYAGVVSISLVILGLLLVLNLDTDKYLGRIWAGTIVNIAITIYVLATFLQRKKGMNFILEDWKFCLKLSAPLLVHLIATTIIGQSSRLFIVEYEGETEAAIFTVAFGIGMIGLLIADAFNNAWSPWYLDHTKSGKVKLVNQYARNYSMIIASGFVLVMLLTPEILRFMAPEPYWSGSYTVLLITIGVFFQFLYRFPLGYEQYKKNMKWVALCTIVSAAINLVLNYLLVPMRGIEGAAIAMLIAYLVLFTLHELVARFILGDYNVKFSSYIPSALVVIIAMLFSYILMESFYFRLVAAIGYCIIFSYLAYRIWSGEPAPKLIKERNGAR